MVEFKIMVIIYIARVSIRTIRVLVLHHKLRTSPQKASGSHFRLSLSLSLPLIKTTSELNVFHVIISTIYDRSGQVDNTVNVSHGIVLGV